ncbi:hypothetical protein THAOC_27844, partial [Thalassiosira oceanica]
VAKYSSSPKQTFPATTSLDLSDYNEDIFSSMKPEELAAIDERVELHYRQKLTMRAAAVSVKSDDDKPTSATAGLEKSRCYYEAISWFARCKKDGEMPDINYAGVDFEPAFFQAIDKFLGELFKVGCDFHFKQGPKKKCDEIGMPKPLTSLILTYLDYARVLPMEEMKDKGIYYLQHLIYDETSSLPELDEGFPYAKWIIFWEYFERVWCRDDFLAVVELRRPRRREGGATEQD